MNEYLKDNQSREKQVIDTRINSVVNLSDD